MTYISVKQILEMLFNSVPKESAEDLCTICRNLGMTNQTFDVDDIDVGHQPYDVGYHFSFHIDRDTEAKFEILAVLGQIYQAGLQVFLPSPSTRSVSTRLQQEVESILVNTYGPGNPIKNESISMITYRGDDTAAYAANIWYGGLEMLTVKIGNRRFIG
jgi:hypothetical protein